MVLNTNFTNKLNEEFDVYIPEIYYDISLTEVDQEIIDKAKEIINEDSDKPNYYKLGQFVNNYLTYDLSYSGKDLTVKQIYDQKKGVCEHYTKLYNAMLNAIGIKAINISGWAFQGNETFLLLQQHQVCSKLFCNKRLHCQLNLHSTRCDIQQTKP